jgi:CRISPR-associated protein Csd1
MLLQRLNEYADRLDLPPTLYGESPVRYVVELTESGEAASRVPTDTTDPATPRTRRGVRRLVPQVQRTVSIKPLLLADNAEYTLGLPRDEAKAARVASAHAAYLDLLNRCAATTREPAVEAVRTFLQSDPLAQLDLPEDFDRGAILTFRVGDDFPVDLPAVQAFWAAENDPDATPDQPAPVMQCVVCGQERPVLKRLQAKLKGVPGGQTSGTALISANADAFESYGLEASLVAPTCAACGERFTKAANALLADERNRLFLGGAAFLFWTRDDVGFSFRDFFDQPQPEEVRALLASVRTGKPIDVDETAFYATVLSGSGGRAVVRDWLDTTVGEARRHLAVWFERQRIVGPRGEDPQFLGLYALAAATVRDPRTELAPPTPRALWRGALTGTPLPSGLLYQAVRRARAEQAITRQRAALIKLVLLSQQPDAQEDAMVQLDPDHPSAAYHCGRLLAILEEVQRAAIPRLSATIVDRFYGTASTAPLTVFPRLMRGVQPHLAKLERDRPGAYRAFQRRLEDILGGMRDFPTVLTMADQARFALGYYHQRAHDRAEARAAVERRRMGLAATDEVPAEALEPVSQAVEEREN